MIPKFHFPGKRSLETFSSPSAHFAFLSLQFSQNFLRPFMMWAFHPDESFWKLQVASFLYSKPKWHFCSWTSWGVFGIGTFKCTLEVFVNVSRNFLNSSSAANRIKVQNEVFSTSDFRKQGTRLSKRHVQNRKGNFEVFTIFLRLGVDFSLERFKLLIICIYKAWGLK